MTYSMAVCRLYSPKFYSINEIRNAALYILRCGRWAGLEDVIRAKRALRGDVARRRERLTTERAMEIIRIKADAKLRRQLRQAAMLEAYEALRTKAETGADYAELARMEDEAMRRAA